MNEQTYALDFAASMDGYSATLPRSRQTDIGISDVGLCRAKATYILRGTEHSDSPDTRAAEMGLAVHAYVASARSWAHPEFLYNYPVTARLPSGFAISGTADEIDKAGEVTDYKTVATAADLAYKAKVGMTEQQQFQVILYYLGAMQQGLVPEVGGICRIAWLARAGDTADMVVHQIDFDRQLVAAADEWLASVAYAARHNELAPQDKPLVWCRKFCEFYRTCRGEITEGNEVTDPEYVLAAQTYDDHHKLANEHTAIAEGARRELIPLRGADPRFFVTLDDGSTIAWARVYGPNSHWRIVKR